MGFFYNEGCFKVKKTLIVKNIRRKYRRKRSSLWQL